MDIFNKMESYDSRCFEFKDYIKVSLNCLGMHTCSLVAFCVFYQTKEESEILVSFNLLRKAIILFRTRSSYIYFKIMLLTYSMESIEQTLPDIC